MANGDTFPIVRTDTLTTWELSKKNKRKVSMAFQVQSFRTNIEEKEWGMYILCLILMRSGELCWCWQDNRVGSHSHNLNLEARQWLSFKILLLGCSWSSSRVKPDFLWFRSMWLTIRQGQTRDFIITSSHIQKWFSWARKNSIGFMDAQKERKFCFYDLAQERCILLFISFYNLF